MLRAKKLPNKLANWMTCLFFLLALLPATGFTTSSKNPAISSAEHAISKATEMALWEEVEWLNLIHYQKEFGAYLSQVDDARFFYADDGKENPQAELTATIRQLFTEVDDHNEQAQCKYIARSEWLTQQLNINKNALPTVHCSEYLEWRELTQADSVTLIFPAYHLNSPSSMFGHTLLRLDNSKDPESDWLSFAVNFGADINNDDNSLLYAFRGLAGGYPGIFVTEPYFKKIQEYNRIEHRDIWEYKLNLSPEETQKMIDHLWELKTINFDYYFFDENCSYRLLELLEVARPSIELTDEFILTAIPVDTVRAIERTGMIKSTHYRPARATEIQYTLNTLTDHQRSIILRLSNDITVLKSDAFNKLSVKQQKQAVDLAYKYLRYEKTKQERDQGSAKRSHQLLLKLNTYPVEINISNKITAPLSPEKGHNSKRSHIGFGQRGDNNYAEFGFKMSFHDLEDNPGGFLQGAEINTGTITIRAQENTGLQLHKLEIIDIFSLTPRNKFFTPLSWQVNTGFERQLTNNKEQLIYQFNGGAGGAWKLIKNHQFHVLATGRVEINKQLKRLIEPAIGFTAGFLSHFSHTTAHLEFSGEQFLDDIYRLRVQYTQNFILSTNHSIKFSAEHQWQENNTEFSDISLNYQYYF